MSSSDEIIINDLAHLPVSVGWREEQRNGKATKVPCSPRTGWEAKSTDAATWATSGEAEIWAIANRGAGDHAPARLRKGATLKAAGYSYDAMRDALLADEDSDISEWAWTKGFANNERQLHRIFDNAKAALSPDFIRGDEKQILRSHPDSIRTAIKHLDVSLRQNEFSNMTEIHGLTGYGPELTDAGAIRLRFLITFCPPWTCSRTF
jgi:hypothetical protein